MRAANPVYCLMIRRWAPMALLWRLIGRIPAWACRIGPCHPGWRVSALRCWVRILPAAARRWVARRRLPRWMVEVDISPDCAHCRRFMEARHGG